MFTIFDKKENMDDFVNIINAYYTTIKFIYESEFKEILKFLDLFVRINDLHHIAYDIYWTPTVKK